MSLISKITDTVGLTDTEGAKDAIDRSTAITKAALRKARTAITNSTWKAFERQKQGKERAIAELRKGRTRQLGELNKGFRRGTKGFERAIDTLEGSQQNFSPFVEGGQEAFDLFNQGSTAGGFADNIRMLTESGVLDPLVDERRQAEDARLSQLGLSRSSGGFESSADIGTEAILGIENQLSGRQLQGAGVGLDAANSLTGVQQNIAGMQQGMGALGTQFGRDRAGVIGGMASNIANLKEAERLRAAGLSQEKGINLANISTQLGAAGSQGALARQTASQAPGQFLQDLLASAAEGAGKAAATASDPILKTNIQKVGEIGPLNVYTWDWVVEGISDMKKGFMADEVQTLYPDHVSFVNGFRMVHYDTLLKELGGTI